jgi:osmoprotectant transport system permease protein
VFALVLYSILPVLNNVIAGMKSVSSDILEAAQGMGMSPRQVLWRVEMPIAAPVVFAGIRTSVIINIGTATLGSIVGAGGLGAPIVSGLVRNNNAFVFQGAFATAVLALTLDRLFAFVEKRLNREV